MSTNQTTADESKEAFARLQERMRGVMGLLTPFEQEVITMRFGLDGNPARSLGDVGGRFGIDRQEIRRIEAKILRKLRQVRREEG